MRVNTTARDCLYVNWALPVERMPTPPPPLRYEAHKVNGERFALLTALFFRHQGLRFAGLPMIRFSYPQLNVRVYVLDRDGAPAVLFRRMLVPAWVLPGAWLVSRHPASGARLDYPRPSRRQGGEEAEGGGWQWRASNDEGDLRIHARLSSPRVGSGPDFGSWERTVDYFRQRSRGYSLARDGLRRVETSHPSVAVWPMTVDAAECGLLERCVGHQPWPAPHSAFLCPEIPFTFELAAPRISVLTPAAVPLAATDPAMLRESHPDQTAA